MSADQARGFPLSVVSAALSAALAGFGGSVAIVLQAARAVGVPDILALVSAWGACPGPCCEADLDGSGAVTFADLLAQIAAWGG